MNFTQIIKDRRRFISRLKFEDKSANVVSFANPYSEQVALVEALANPEVRRVVVLKPRQIGISTANCADTFYETFAAKKPLRSLVVTDHNKTTRSMFMKFCTFYEHLPSKLRAANPFKLNRTEKTLISQRTGALIDHLTARGDTHGRGWTYQRLIAEEVAFWPNPEEIWGALRSTLHEGPDQKIIIISTPNGPGDFYHQRVLGAVESIRQGDKSTRFIFSRWSDHRVYRKEVPEGWEPTEEEHKLSEQYALDMEQLYWRHWMIHGVDGIGELRFRREYPLTLEDGFLILEGCWFDTDYLTMCMNDLPKPLSSERRIYHHPVMNHNYVIGVDPSWCSGGDYAVATVMDENGRQCAVFSTNMGGEDLFAEKVCDLSRYYLNARVLCEANTGGAGRVVIKILLQNNVPIWRDPKGKDWVTSRGNKEMAYSFARQLINADGLELNDHSTIRELMHIRDINGKIEGQDGYHDDHSDSLVLAIWGLQTLPGFDGNEKHMPRERIRNLNPMERIRRATR